MFKRKHMIAILSLVVSCCVMARAVWWVGIGLNYNKNQGENVLMEQKSLSNSTSASNLVRHNRKKSRSVILSRVSVTRWMMTYIFIVIYICISLFISITQCKDFFFFCRTNQISWYNTAHTTYCILHFHFCTFSWRAQLFLYIHIHSTVWSPAFLSLYFCMVM